jgi:acetoin utilization deacetylase AcuC-like enzyme
MTQGILFPTPLLYLNNFISNTKELFIMHIFYSEKCREYWQHGHPENPERIKDAYHILKKYFDFSDVEPCSDDDLLLVHSHNMVEKIRKGGFFDSDSPDMPGIFEHAKLAAGGAIAALRSAIEEENSFSLMRPPGHHAGKNFFGGFCYFNNIAIAVEKALKIISKVAIIDIDGHHGNGTQDIFFGRRHVLYVSLHQKGAFPLTGFVSEKNCLNYPLAPGTKGDEYLEVLDKALESVADFNPDMIAVSAGFDSYENDPLLELGLDLKTFYSIGAAISGLEKPVSAVLEGGYSKELGKCIYQFLRGLE